jgi:hypothetical protein
MSHANFLLQVEATLMSPFAQAPFPAAKLMALLA